jgi:phosphoglycolate phosphatase-like HAD superfamily hydrolase
VTKLILFDIDGTLVLTGGAGVRALSRAFTEIFGVHDALNGFEVAGRTDAWILREIAARHGLAWDTPTARRFHETYVSHLREEVRSPGPRKGVMPGIRALLNALAARDDVIVGLLTGNVEEGARIKLEHFDLWRYFRCGAFGDGALERNPLLYTALNRVEACGGPRIPPEDVVVVGDTPHDIAVAAAGGSRAVAVATGSYDLAALGAAGADVVMNDLSDLRASLTALGL